MAAKITGSDVLDSCRTPCFTQEAMVIQPDVLTNMIQCQSETCLVVDSRTFCEYNTSHIINSVNVWASKMRKKRLQQDSVSVFDYLRQAGQTNLKDRWFCEIVVYDQNSVRLSDVPTDSFLYVLLLKLKGAFETVSLLAGGFLEFQSLFPELCEDSSQKASPLTSLSQPCLPARTGLTKILPFMFLGSQLDANNKQLLLEHNITYEVNVSTSCPKPDFLQESHFMRIPVKDNFNEKLLPHFAEAFTFIDKVRESGNRVLVHCLAGISRSPTVAIAFVMKHLRMHYDEAYRYVKHRRPTISPNINFVGQLLELDRQLLGDGVLYRSPTAPLYFDHDNDVTPSPDCVVLRSSSSSSVESFRKEKDTNKRGLLFHGLKDTPLSWCPSSPSSAFASLSLLTKQVPPQEYVSDRLPSSPVISPLPEFFYTEEEEHSSENTRRSLCDSTLSEVSGRDIVNNTQSCKYTSVSQTKTSTKSSVKVNSVVKESFSTTASINVKSCNDYLTGDTRGKPVCIVEVSHEPSPLTYVDVRPSEPMIVREKLVMATPSSPETPCDIAADKPNQSEHLYEPDSTGFIPLKSFIPRLPTEGERNMHLSTSGTSQTPSCYMYESRPLPRCYSSSETHLNTRKLLESQNDSSSPHDTYAKKSFSTDEVGHGFQSSIQLPSPVIVAATPSELARCDSWSTSGLGSEISDLESLQDDAQSVLTDDTMGPFDAVFADVFPSEFQDSLLREPPRKLSPCDDREAKRSKSLNEANRLRLNRLRQESSDNGEGQHTTIRATSSLNAAISSSKVPVGTPLTPRPISLPGVTGTYFGTLAKPNSSSSMDMGVDMDESPLWEHSDPAKECVRFPSIESSSSSSTARICSLEAKDKSKAGFLDIDEGALYSGRNSEQSSLRMESEDGGFEEKHFQSSYDSSEGVREQRRFLEHRLHSWDYEFKKKMRNIQKNISISSWDSLHKEECESSKVTGFHLAQELMHSMEELLETEIGDIKRQASALSTKFGLPTAAPIGQIVDPKSQSAPISFCPTLRQGIVRSAKSRNLHDESSYVPTLGLKDKSFSYEPTSVVHSVLRSRNPGDTIMKESPVYCSHGLYRVRSCPSLGEDGLKTSYKELLRYSCGALDLLTSLKAQSRDDIARVRSRHGARPLRVS